MLFYLIHPSLCSSWTLSRATRSESSHARDRFSQFVSYPEEATLTLEPYSAWESRHQLIQTIDCEDSSVPVIPAIVLNEELGGSSSMMNRP